MDKELTERPVFISCGNGEGERISMATTGHHVGVEHKFRPRSKMIERDFPGGPVVGTLLSLLRAWVQSLVGGLRSHKLCGMANKQIE